MKGVRETWVAWVGRLPKPVRLLASFSLLTLVLVLGPDLVSHRAAEAPRQGATRASASAATSDAEWQDYASIEPFAPASGPGSEAPGAEGDAVALDAGAASMFECIIEPNQVVAIGSPVTGRIDSILVDRAEVVEAGQALVRLDSRVEVAAVAVARARAEMDGQLLASEAAA
jgi:multidrug efflux pump subunit AcrA (membrane-fusion protein)